MPSKRTTAPRQHSPPNTKVRGGCGALLADERQVATRREEERTKFATTILPLTVITLSQLAY